MNINSNENDWDTIIKSERSLLDIDFVGIWKYRDLLRMFVFRDFVTYYKQTILGPLWFFIQPIFTTVIYVIIFGRFAGMSTDGKPKLLFYLLGIITWSYFADCLTKTATVFIDNQHIFGKVYFPRLIKPISIIISNLFKYFIQLMLFLLFLTYFIIFKKTNISFNLYLFSIPILILISAFLGLGMGLIISSLTTKYRDLIFLLNFGVQIFMYATPVIYPLSSVPEKYKYIFILNPMTGILEGFRYVFLGNSNQYPYETIGISILITFIILCTGIIMFNRTEKNFMDTI